MDTKSKTHEANPQKGFVVQINASENFGLGGEGIEIVLNAQPLRVDGLNGQSVSVTVRTGAGERKIEGSHLLVAVGRIANTAAIGLDEAGIALDARGFIKVDEWLKTTAPGVWAIGECAGSPQFTHVSVDDFRIVRDNMAGGNRKTSDRLIPHVVFTDPPLARVGLSESEAQRQGIPVRVAKLPMRRVLRTNATDETEGFMKVLVGATGLFNAQYMMRMARIALMPPKAMRCRPSETL